MKLEGVSKSFDGAIVLDGFSASFPERGIVGIAGPSGRGKTTLLRIVSGLEQPDSGTLEGVPNRIAMQFEDDRLFPWMDAIGNVTLVGCDEVCARRLLDALDLGDKAHESISALSGGQKRRVALARALAFPAPLRILDEPTARLDAAIAKTVIDVIAQECADGLTIVATHDDALLARCDVVHEL